MQSATSIGRISDAPNASQGFNRSCAHAALQGREPMTFQAFLARHGKNWPQDGEAVAVESDDQAARIAALEAELASLRAPVTEPKAPKAKKVTGWKVGRKFSYAAKNGNVTLHTVIAIEDGKIVTNLLRKNGENYRFAIAALDGYAKAQVS